MAMINTLYLPELREMLASGDLEGLLEFCTALHAGRTAEFMEGLNAEEIWGVLQSTDSARRVEIFTYLPEETQIAILEACPPAEVSHLIAEMPPDDRVDLIKKADPDVVEEVLKRVPTKERRDILRLRAYPEGTAGALMTTEVAYLTENLTVEEALQEIGSQSHEFETIYYIYIVDEEMHLRGLVSARQLVTHLSKPQMLLQELMVRDLVTVSATDDQEAVAEKVADFNFLAIPVVDTEQRLVGIITHDDVIDVFQEEATRDAHLAGAVEPLTESYLATPWLQLTRHRLGWLALLFGGALLTIFAMREYNQRMQRFAWIAWFVPLIISTGGNSGSQSATLMIRALTTKEITPGDWRRIIGRELVIGLLLGSCLSLIGYSMGCFMAPSVFDALVLPLTIVLVVTCGTLLGSLLPLFFHKLGFDPALMSTPFIAGISDIVGIVLYMTVAGLILQDRF